MARDEKRAAQKRRRYYDRKKANICVECDRASLPSSVYCYKHLERHRVKAERLNPIMRERYLKEGRCGRCGAILDAEDAGYKCCVNCRMHDWEGSPYN